MAADIEGARFGEQLRREREQRGVAVEAMCATTKVPIRHILSLEAGAFRDLPGGVFRRGFVRSYLRALGLEEGSWMDRFEKSCGLSGVGEPADTAWTVFAENVKNTRIMQRRRNRPSWVWVPILLLFAAAAGWLTFHAVRHRNVVSHPLHTTAMKSWVDNVSSR